MGVLQGMQGVGLAARAHGGAAAGRAVLGGTPWRLGARHGRRDGGQSVRAESLHLGHWLGDSLLPRVSLRRGHKTRSAESQTVSTSKTTISRLLELVEGLCYQSRGLIKSLEANE